MIKKSDIQDIYSLSPMQQGMLFHAMYEQELLLYFEQFVYRFYGKLNLQHFQSAWNELLKRHDIFRSIFVTKNVPEPLQLVLKARELEFEFEDLSFQNQSEREAYLNSFLLKDRQRYFRLSSEVMLRVSVFRLDENTHTVVLSCHHIIADGWSLGPLMTELFQCYQAFQKGITPALFPAPQYKAYIQWLGKQDQAISKKYWQNYLADYLKLSTPPGRLAGSKHETKTVARHQVTLNATQVQALQKIAVQAEVTLNTLFLAFWGIALAQYNDAEDVVFAATVSGRPPELLNVENMLGLFINAVPVRVKIAPKATFPELARTLQKDARNSEPHHYYSLADIQGETLLKQKLLDHLITFQSYPLDQAFAEKLERELGLRIEQTASFENINYDFNILLLPEGQQLSIVLCYNHALYDSAQIHTIGNHLSYLIDSIINEPSRTLASLELIAKDQREQILQTAPHPSAFSHFWGRTYEDATDEDSKVYVLDHLLRLSPEETLGRIYLSVRKDSTLTEYAAVESPFSLESKLIKTDFIGLRQRDNKLKVLGPYAAYEQMKISQGEWLAFPSKAMPCVLCATFTADPFVPYLEWWLKQFELEVSGLLAPYNQVFQQLLNADSVLRQNEGLNLILVRFEDWIRDLALETDQAYVNHLDQHYWQLVEVIQQNFAAVTFVGVFPVSKHLSLSSKVKNKISELNTAWKTFLSNSERFHLLDFEQVETLYELEEIFDRQKDQTGHLPFSDEYFAAAATYGARQILAWKKPHFKVIAVDCDNTLWNGIVGESGLKVRVEHEYLWLQQFLIDRHQEGWLIVLCSKNSEEDVWEVFDKHPDMLLKREHIVAHRINWERKSRNIREMAKELNLGVNSFIFLDDSTAECSEVMHHCPEVLTLLLPQSPSHFPSFLKHVWAFDKFQVTDEDRNRSAMVVAEKQRQEHSEALSLEDFLKSLELKVWMNPVQPQQIDRVAQLTQRTNQFNLSTLRRTSHEIEKLLQDDHHQGWSVHVKDKFGDYGLVGVVIARKETGSLYLDSFLLSCRVLGREVETAILSGLRKFCLENQLKHIDADFRPTPKNQPMRQALAKANWQILQQTPEQTRYQISTAQLPEKVEQITFFYNEAFESAPIVPEKSKEPKVSHKTEPPREAASSRKMGNQHGWKVLLTLNENQEHKAYYLPLLHHETTALMSLAIEEHEAQRSTRSYVAPRDETEEKLVDLWKKLLKRELLGIEDDFFDLGGHSLTATRLVSRIYKIFEVELGLKEVFDHPTISQLSSLIQQKITLGYHSIEVVEAQEYYELSHAQKRLWVLSQFQDNALVYNISGAFLLEGSLSTEKLKFAFQQLIERHESLRTTFLTVDGEPKQKIHSNAEFQLKELDERSAEDPLAQAKLVVSQEFENPFDLENGPLIRGTLLTLNESQWVFLLSMHHIICDGWSWGILVNEVFKLYNASLQRQNETLERLGIQYKDYAVWQNQLLDTPNIRKDREYWHQKLSGELPLLDLPSDFPRPPTISHEGKKLHFQLSEALTASLHQLCGKYQVSLFMALLGLIKVLLHRYTGQEDLIIGSPIAGRNHPDLEAQVGCFVNTLALRDTIKGTDTFADVLRKMKQTTTEAYNHQLYPFDKLVEELEIPRYTDRTPVFNVMVVLQNQDMFQPEIEGLSIAPFLEFESISKFDLNLHFTEVGSILNASIEYRTDLFQEWRMLQLWTHLEQLLHSVLLLPKTDGRHIQPPIRSLSLSSQNEVAKMLETFNQTRVSFPETITILDLFAKHVAQQPKAIAVAYEEQQLSYEELDAYSHQVAQHIMARGIQPKTLVGLFLERSLEMLVGMLGILKSGAAYVPIDPLLPLDRIRFILNDTQASLVVTQSAMKHKLPAIPIQILCLDTDLSEKDTHSAHKLPTVVPEDLVYVLFTSGTTGQPKGVQIEHRQLFNYLCAIQQRLALPEKANYATVSTFAADLGNTVVFPSLCGGGCLHIISQNRITDPDALAEYFNRHSMDVLKITPSHLKALLNAEFPENVLPRKRLILGGESAPWDLIREVQRLRPECRLLNHYGPTETTVGVLTYDLTPQSPHAYLSAVPLGKPLANVEIYILDPYLQPVPIGIPGELYIGGAALARGYLNREELTQEKFMGHPFKAKARLYKTGDLARYLPDGNVVFLGRVDDQVKIRGYRVELREIEQCLKQQEQIDACAVIVKANANKESEIYAYLTGKGTINMKEVKNALKKSLPEYMIPAQMLQLEKIPLNANGKVDRKALPEIALTSLEPSKKVQPVTETEKQLALLWEEVLSNKELGRDDNFFERGGNSLKAIKLITKVRAAFKVPISLTLIYQKPSLREMGEYLSAPSKNAPVFKQELSFLLNQEGERKLFCFPDISGYGLLYKNLADQLEAYALYAFNFRKTANTIADYVQSVLQIQPEGPYQLFGYSAGGNLAFQIAKELTKQGKAVSDLILLDSRRRVEPDAYSEEDLEWLIHHYLAAKIEEIHENSELRNEFKHVITQYAQFLSEHLEQGTIPSRIHLIRSTDPNHDPHAERWDQVTEGPFALYRGYGSHFEMLQPPNLSRNIAILKKILLTIPKRESIQNQKVNLS
ncbi:amino acid adenylation domain-containing protein [Deltaproteobacteria bacterium TL4]